MTICNRYLRAPCRGDFAVAWFIESFAQLVSVYIFSCLHLSTVGVHTAAKRVVWIQIHSLWGWLSIITPYVAVKHPLQAFQHAHRYGILRHVPLNFVHIKWKHSRAHFHARCLCWHPYSTACFTGQVFMPIETPWQHAHLAIVWQCSLVAVTNGSDKKFAT